MIKEIKDYSENPPVVYSPEEYAALWGCDTQYDMSPNLLGDGYLFYNFGSEHQVRDREYLKKFLAAIYRTMQMLAGFILDGNETDINEAVNDLKSMAQLKDHVQELIDKLA